MIIGLKMFQLEPNHTSNSFLPKLSFVKRLPNWKIIEQRGSSHSSSIKNSCFAIWENAYGPSREIISQSIVYNPSRGTLVVVRKEGCTSSIF